MSVEFFIVFISFSKGNNTCVLRRFTQSILKESHQLVLQKIDQAHVAVALAHVNKLETMLVDQCRTPYQFEMQAQHFLTAIKAIEDLIECIQFHFEFGFHTH